MRRFAWFDCLRCLAVCLVIFAHAGKLSDVLPAFLVGPLSSLQSISWTGVDFFFVLSGFLVSGLLFEEHDRTGTLQIGRFLIRRAFKIIPAFYFLILVTFLVDAFFHHVNFTHLFHDIFFLQSYRAGNWSHAWTLAIEVHFYLLLALLLAGLSRGSARKDAWLGALPPILCLVFAVSFLARFFTSYLSHRAFNFHREIEPSHLHLDVLAAGVLLRYLYHYHSHRLAFLLRAKPVWIGLGLLLVGPSAYLWTPHSPGLTAWVPTSNALGFSLILFEATQFSFPCSGPGAWMTRPLDYLGKHSYSIYLWHLPTKDWLVDPLLPTRGPGYLPFLFIASLAVGTALSIALEAPVLHLRNRLFPSRISAAIPGSKQPKPKTALRA
jgi:peptidoglycan/LPS O-acetylase OafA/YrhL